MKIRKWKGQGSIEWEKNCLKQIIKETLRDGNLKQMHPHTRTR